VEYTATITGFGDETVEFSVEPGYPSAAEPTVDVTLLVGYPKQDKLEQVSLVAEAGDGGGVFHGVAVAEDDGVSRFPPHDAGKMVGVTEGD